MKYAFAASIEVLHFSVWSAPNAIPHVPHINFPPDICSIKNAPSFFGFYLPCLNITHT
jgi:hypothetical protein